MNIKKGKYKGTTRTLCTVYALKLYMQQEHMAKYMYIFNVIQDKDWDYNGALNDQYMKEIPVYKKYIIIFLLVHKIDKGFTYKEL